MQSQSQPVDRAFEPRVNTRSWKRDTVTSVRKEKTWHDIKMRINKDWGIFRRYQGQGKGIILTLVNLSNEWLPEGELL